MNDDYATDSERVFADLCRSQGYSIEKIPEEGNKQTPDFKVTVGAVIVMAEVKQFDQNDQGQAIEDAVGQGEFHISNVDFEHDGGLGRKLGKQAAQLRAAAEAGLPTLGVIYSNRPFGPTDYQVGHALKNGSIYVAAEISAVLHVRNEHINGDTPAHELYPNATAAVPFPDGLF